MNEVLKVLKERRSIRAFRPEPLKKEDLDAIVEAARTYLADAFAVAKSFKVVFTRPLPRISRAPSWWWYGTPPCLPDWNG